MECQICCEKMTFKKSLRGNIPCYHCDIRVCRNCVQKYILSVYDFPKCMNCKTYFDIEYINSNLQKKYIKNQYNKHLENILYNREHSFFKESYSIILKNKQRNSLLEHLKISNILIRIFKSHGNKYRHRTKIQENIKIKIQSNLKDLNTINTFNFKMHCIIKDCNGLINSNWQCSECATQICPHCYKVNGANHVCIGEDIRTVALLKKAHPCPSCSLLITKINGCDQMYCTNCNTPFSWRTGHILYGQVHNPHYFEWARHIGRSEQECELINPDLIPFKIKESLFKKVNGYILNNRDDISILYGNSKHPIKRIFKILLRFINIRLNDEIVHWNQLCTSNTEKLRVDFLSNNISENSFKKILRLRYNKTEKYKDVFNILHTFSNTIEEYIRLLWSSDADTENTEKQVVKIIDDINHLRHYFNFEFGRLSLKHNIYCPYISNTYRIYMQLGGHIKGNFGPNDLDPLSDINIHRVITQRIPMSLIYNNL